jgi:hypothetical protein
MHAEGVIGVERLDREAASRVEVGHRQAHRADRLREVDVFLFAVGWAGRREALEHQPPRAQREAAIREVLLVEAHARRADIVVGHEFLHVRATEERVRLEDQELFLGESTPERARREKVVVLGNRQVQAPR